MLFPWHFLAFIFFHERNFLHSLPTYDFSRHCLFRHLLLSWEIFLISLLLESQDTRKKSATKCKGCKPRMLCQSRVKNCCHSCSERTAWVRLFFRHFEKERPSSCSSLKCSLLNVLFISCRFFRNFFSSIHFQWQVKKMTQKEASAFYWFFSSENDEWWRWCSSDDEIEIQILLSLSLSLSLSLK
jgi:hypothetical protein